MPSSRASIARENAHLLQKRDSLGCAVVHLSAGNERNRGQVQLQKPRVLDDETVYSERVELLDQALRLRELIVAQQRVYGDVDACPVLMRVRDQPGDIIQFVARALASAEMMRAYVDRVSPAVNRGYAADEVLGRGK